ncbi:MAG: NAD(+) diphosphatase [Lachnospiraceae bacterium]|nr:NAD(+) diphosphatase [Lachnospiraceae bacterium]
MKPQYKKILDNAYYLFAISEENYFLADPDLKTFPVMENSEQLITRANALSDNERLFFTMNINRLRDLLFVESANNIKSLSADPGSMTPVIFAAATGSHMAWWKRSRRYCGFCRAETEPSKTERAMVCPACGNIEYPKISPAIIVAIIKKGKTPDEDRLLLVRNNYGSYRKLALVAGFVEIGESFEQAIHREALEETGLKVKNLKYYKNQPWGLSYAQMIGFTAELDGDDTIKLQENELSEGGWYLRSEVPNNPSCLSVGNEMIHMFRIGML